MAVWFVTGASRGFGAEIVCEVLARGEQVVATARNPEAVRETFPDAGASLLVEALDVSDEAQVAHAVAEPVARFGRIDVLVNNAGRGLLGAVEEASDSEVQYAVEGLSEAMRMELAPLGIQVTIVEPGFFRTDFLDSSSLGHTALELDDYTPTAGQTRTSAQTRNHAQPGDPVRAAKAIVDTAQVDQPLRLQLGADCVARVEQKLSDIRRELEQWRPVALATAFEDTSA